MPLDVRGLAPLLQVYDIPTSIQFYTEKLGFELVTHAAPYKPGRFHWALLHLNGVELMLNTAYESEEARPPVPDPARVAAHGDTGLYFGSPDVDDTYSQL
jgi:glyoxylase I family protein